QDARCGAAGERRGYRGRGGEARRASAAVVAAARGGMATTLERKPVASRITGCVPDAGRNRNQDERRDRLHARGLADRLRGARGDAGRPGEGHRRDGGRQPHQRHRLGHRGARIAVRLRHRPRLRRPRHRQEAARGAAGAELRALPLVARAAESPDAPGNGPRHRADDQPRHARGRHVARWLDRGDARREALQPLGAHHRRHREWPPGPDPPVIALIAAGHLYLFQWPGEPPKALFLLPTEGENACGVGPVNFGAPDGSWSSGSAVSQASCEFRQSVQPDSLLPAWMDAGKASAGAEVEVAWTLQGGGASGNGHKTTLRAEAIAADALRMGPSGLSATATKVKNDVRVVLKNGGSGPILVGDAV